METDERLSPQVSLKGGGRSWYFPIPLYGAEMRLRGRSGAAPFPNRMGMGGKEWGRKVGIEARNYNAS